MQVKQQGLLQYIQKKIAPISWLTGQDHYLLQESLKTLKNHIKKMYECDEKIITVQAAEDWKTALEEANNYSLFADIVLLTLYYDKKTLDAKGKKTLTTYLESINKRCFIIIIGPNVPAKQLTWLAQHSETLLVAVYPLSSDAMRDWIAEELRKNSFRFSTEIPELIHQYTQGNMLACSQVIEKLSLTYEPNSIISAQEALEQVSNQCNLSLFELVDACLLGQSSKSVQILRQAANDKTEAILVLWILTQEIRTLLQLHYLTQRLDLKSACSQLKIWPQRINLYQLSLKRLNKAMLQELLHYCQVIDELIKSNLNTQVWNVLEQLAFGLCTGMIGGLCKV